MPIAFPKWFYKDQPLTGNQVERLLRQLDLAAQQAAEEMTVARARDLQQRLDQLKINLGIAAGAAFDPAVWQGLSEDNRRTLSQTAKKLLSDLSAEGLGPVGMTFFGFVCFVLLAIGVTYVSLHHYFPATLPAVDPGRIVEITDVLRRVELSVEELNKKSAETSGTEEERNKVADTAKQAVKDLVSDLQQKLQRVSLGSATHRLLGEAVAESGKGKLTDSTLVNLKAAVLADLQSLDTPYFWSDPIKKWLEICFWAEMGVLVGILFYLTSEFYEWRFDKSDIFTMVAESISAPVVTLVVFFLFDLAGVTGIDITKAPSATKLGVAFILGFAIRRTIGLLETIKKKLLPDP